MAGEVEGGSRPGPESRDQGDRHRAETVAEEGDQRQRVWVSPMEVVEQDQRRLLDGLEVAQGGVEVGGSRVEPGRGRAPGDVERGPGSNPSQGFADDPEVKRGLYRLPAAHPHGEPGSLLAGPFQHTRFAEPSFGDHEQGLPLPGARAFENKSDGRHYAFPFEHGVPARILSLRGLTDDPPPRRA